MKIKLKKSDKENDVSEHNSSNNKRYISYEIKDDPEKNHKDDSLEVNNHGGNNSMNNYESKQNIINTEENLINQRLKKINQEEGEKERQDDNASKNEKVKNS